MADKTGTTVWVADCNECEEQLTIEQWEPGLPKAIADFLEVHDIGGRIKWAPKGA